MLVFGDHIQWRVFVAVSGLAPLLGVFQSEWAYLSALQPLLHRHLPHFLRIFRSFEEAIVIWHDYLFPEVELLRIYAELLHGLLCSDLVPGSMLPDILDESKLLFLG